MVNSAGAKAADRDVPGSPAPLTVLHLGSGRMTLKIEDQPSARIITLDADGDLNPEVVCKLGVDAIPLPSDSVDIAVAIHVLEHIGRQGETGEWFYFWEELYRVLKPGGMLQFESPLYSSIWAWADPSHSRALSPPAFTFFAQESYRQEGSHISPFRIACDFEPVKFEVFPDGNESVRENEKVSHFRGELRAIKPLNRWWED
jgi:SAM-dependent methyltransferase